MDFTSHARRTRFLAHLSAALCAAIALCAAPSVRAAEYWIDQANGSDSNDGRSEAAAFASFAYFTNNNFNADTTIRVKPGRYVFQAPMKDYNKAGASLRILGIGNREDIVLDGGASPRIVGLYGGTNCVVSTLTFTGCHNDQAKNFNRGAGSAIWSYQAASTLVTNCVFRDCTSATAGGALGLKGGSNRVVDCIFENCAATNRGGAVICNAGNDTFLRCVFKGCLSGSDTAAGANPAGGAVSIYSASGSTIFRDCLFVGNTALYRGGAIEFKNRGLIENCTFVGNATPNSAYGTIWCQTTEIGVTNCIFSGNTNNGNAAQVIFGEKTDVGKASAYCCIMDGTFYNQTGTNIQPAGGPGFADTSSGDYRLVTASPCRNAGANLPWMPGATDLDGKARIKEGAADIGCYEYDPTKPTMLIIR